MRRINILPLIAVLLIKVFIITGVNAEESLLLKAMGEELNRSFKELKELGEAPLYFMAYEVTEVTETRLLASMGALMDDAYNRKRYLDVDLRVGDFQLDNTHQIRGYWADDRQGGKDIAIQDDPSAIKAILWYETDLEFKQVQMAFTKVKANIAVKVEEEDNSPDFSPAPKNIHIEDLNEISWDRKPWIDRLKTYSLLFKEDPNIYYSSIGLTVKQENKFIVNSEGTRIQMGRDFIRLSLYGETKADDGMDLNIYKSFDVACFDELPDEESILSTIDTIIYQLNALRKAPVVEPFTGPAIMKSRAAGVFFHEIFGHRIEGHRLKQVSNGQTFKKKVGELVMPDFINIYDDPNQKYYNGISLNGHYLYDDEGVEAQRVDVVRNGVLINFLMCRTPVEGFNQSGGHGRRQYGNKIVSRQGNLFVESTRTIPYADLKAALIEELKSQQKEYGLVFEDISGGFTMTGRWTPQAFKVKPVIVYKVYADGRPDELVRGVDIVGTPLSSLTRIIAAADDYNVFNGYCGAESGYIPVSGIAPSMLVSQIEVEKSAKSEDKPPILNPPHHD
ncbi:hypothetical protein JW877_04115 [bacterium]|nr:hypothetical protein [bacterium]